MNTNNIIEIDSFIDNQKIKTPKEYFKKLNYNFPIIADVPELNLNYERGMLLYGLVEKNKPKTIVDIGTAGGYSAICMAKALTDFKIDGRVYTIDLEPHNKIKQYILRSDDGTLMAIQHNTLPVTGIQFHPESIATENGKAILKNFLDGK